MVLQTGRIFGVIVVAILAAPMPAQAESPTPEMLRIVGIAGSQTAVVRAAPNETAAGLGNLPFDSRALVPTDNATPAWLEIIAPVGGAGVKGWLPRALLGQDAAAPNRYRIVKSAAFGATVRTGKGMYVAMIRGGERGVEATGPCAAGVCPIKRLAEGGAVVEGWVLAKDLIVETPAAGAPGTEDIVLARLPEAAGNDGDAAGESQPAKASGRLSNSGVTGTSTRARRVKRSDDEPRTSAKAVDAGRSKSKTSGKSRVAAADQSNDQRIAGNRKAQSSRVAAAPGSKVKRWTNADTMPDAVSGKILMGVLSFALGD